MLPAVTGEPGKVQETRYALPHRAGRPVCVAPHPNPKFYEVLIPHDWWVSALGRFRARVDASYANMRAVQKNDFSISRPSPRRRRRRAGFTIIEVMLAASVMALVFSTSIVTLQSAFQSLDTARNVTLAGQIMMTEMEKMRMSDWAAVSAYPAQSTMLTIDPNFTNNPRISNRFTLSRTVTTVGGNAELLQFTYTTAWKGNGRARSRSYSTYYARYGIHDYFYNTL